MMKLIIRRNENVSEILINEDHRKRGLVLLGSKEHGSTLIDIELAEDFFELGLFSVEFQDDLFTIRVVQKAEKLKGRVGKKLDSIEVFTAGECELVVIPVDTQKSNELAWDYNLIPTRPEHPQYIRRFLNFIKDAVQCDQVAIFHRIDDHMHLLEQSNLNIKNQAEELIYQYVKDIDDTIIYINMHTHTMLFSAGLAPVDFHIVRQKIGSNQEILVYLPLPDKSSHKFSQVKCLVQLCAGSIALHIAMKFTSVKEAKGTSEFLGQSEAINRLRKVIEKVHQTKINTFIYGSESSGKSKAIKQIKSKDGLNYKVIDCSMEVEKLNKELSGKKGILNNSLYQGLVLEGLHLLPISFGAKLIKLIESSDIRVLSTSEKSVKELMEIGFHFELLNLISEMVISIPDLNERVEDVPDLAKDILNKFSEKNNLPKKCLSIAFVKSLQANNQIKTMAQLKAIIHKAALLTEGQMIESDFEVTSAAEYSWDLKKAKEEFAIIQAYKALKVSRNNRNEAAMLLGISPRSLYRLLADSDDSHNDNFVM
jgi:transcriptional regulator of acetoin/glycerol metabolism